MSYLKNALKHAKVSVHISKETGGAYADVREIIESELTRIRAESANKVNTQLRGCDNSTKGRGSDNPTNGQGKRAK